MSLSTTALRFAALIGESELIAMVGTSVIFGLVGWLELEVKSEYKTRRIWSKSAANPFIALDLDVEIV